MKGKHKIVYSPNVGPPTPPTEAVTSEDYINAQDTKSHAFKQVDDDFDSFSESDEQDLLNAGDDIMNIDRDLVQEAWQAWAKDHLVSSNRPCLADTYCCGFQTVGYPSSTSALASTVGKEGATTIPETKSEESEKRTIAI